MGPPRRAAVLRGALDRIAAAFPRARSPRQARQPQLGTCGCYRAALTHNPDLATELDQLLRGIEDWHTPALARPTTAHHERIRDLARAIQSCAAKLLTSAHGPNIARHASIAICREHTDLTSREIALIHNVNHAQPTFAHGTVERRRRKNPDFDDRYRQLLDDTRELQRQAGYAHANLRRGLTRHTGHR